MRKVKFKKWISKVVKKELEISNYPFPTEAYEEETNCWEKEFKNDGLFHQWANAYDESSEGFGNYTIALVELFDGTIIEVLPSNIQFVEPMVMS